jgi:ribosomal protein L11 methyltransferase
MPTSARICWRWSRLIARDAEELWTERLGATGKLNWMVVEKPGRQRLRVEAYFAAQAGALAMQRTLGGAVARFVPKPPASVRSVRIGARLEIVHDEKLRRASGRLIIPYGMAFGSGEHATTLMLLRALAGRSDLTTLPVLDLGTGSGVLALAARAFGARTVAASDFDPAAIRTARRNELLNFSARRVHWEVADARRLRAAPRYGLILANLFSGILIEAAPRMARALAPGGEIWLSGVLRAQQEEVAGACRAAGLRLLGTATRGKWVMQQWATG